VVGVELDARDHPARVVGDYAAYARRAYRGRIGPDPAAERAQNPVHHLCGRPRLCTHPGPAVEDLDPGEAVAAVGDDPLTDCLACEARTAGAEGDGQVQLTGDTEQGDDLVLVREA